MFLTCLYLDLILHFFILVDCSAAVFDIFVFWTLLENLSDDSHDKPKADRYHWTYDVPGKQILILYATEYGFSEDVAQELFDK